MLSRRSLPEGLSAIGMDISETAVDAAVRRHPGCHFIAHSAENLPWPFEPDSLDLIVSFEVIEHLVEPRRLLKGAREVLKPGGHLALTTPSMAASRTSLSHSLPSTVIST